MDPSLDEDMAGTVQVIEATPNPPLSGGWIMSLAPGELPPATWVVREWERYTFQCDLAASVRVGSQQLSPYPGSTTHFEVRFENQLGLATIRAFDHLGACIETHHVEVVAGKFSQATESIAFLKATLAGLHARIASTPFTLAAATERFVRESPTPPSPLFLVHFFHNHGPELHRAIQAVLGNPHQRLTADPELVRPHQVRRIDHEAVLRILQGPHAAGDPHGVTVLERLRPERVWQHLPEDTFDTPENRFVLAISRRMLGAVAELTRLPWYEQDVPAPARNTIDQARVALAMLTMDDRFAPLGPMVIEPAQSRVLQRRDGYRDLALLWQRFQQSREPLFEHLQTAIDLRSVDQLYELWLLFALIDRISDMTGKAPVLKAITDRFGVPEGGYVATFGDHGSLIYNVGQRTYSSIPLRPDYLWRPAEGAWVALDAKFRLQRPAMLTDDMPDDPDKTPVATKAWAKSDDLTKMHAYRDAIPDVRAAVVLYPGTESVFRTVGHGKQHLTLADVLHRPWEGIGAIAMTPVEVAMENGE